MRERTIKEALGSEIKFHADLPRKDKEEIIAVPAILFDARIIEDWDGAWGTSSFALLALELENKERVTTLCGGVAVVRQVAKLLKRNLLPGRIKCFLNKVEGPKGDYYLLDSQEEPATPVESKAPEETKVEEPIF